MLFLVDLQQTSSPSSVCPGDDAIFTCTVTVSLNQIVTLTWVNPLDNADYYAYIISDSVDTPNNTECVAGFAIKLIRIDNSSIVSTATLTGITTQDEGKEISCRYDVIAKTKKITISGKLTCTLFESSCPYFIVSCILQLFQRLQ